MTESQRLLASYVQTGSDPAFRELVTRYIDLVYSTALRLVDGDSHHAEDVAQTVFVDLARRARTLSHDVMLGGWLHRHTCFVAAKTMRGEWRRQSRERQAVEMNALHNDSGEDFSQVTPMLDEAINELDEVDRTAILLRFLEQHDFRRIGQVLGSNEDAARMRVNRALEKLASLLKRRGVTTSAAALTVALSAQAVQAAPIGLALTISTAAVLAGPAVSTSTVIAATKAVAMTTLQKTLITATLAVLAGAGIYEARQAGQLRNRVQTLRQQQAQQIQQLRSDYSAAVSQLAAGKSDTSTSIKMASELLKLRGEVTRLRMEAKEAAQTKIDTPSSDAEMALKSWLKRVKEFKHLPERMPDKVIPELNLLNEEDWLQLAKEPLEHDAKEVNLDDEAVARLVFSVVRAKAKDKLMKVLSRALEGYANANDGQLPADTLQLQPYLMYSHFLGPARVVDVPDSVIDETVLRRYEILRAGRLEDVPGDMTILAERSPVDSEYDTRLRVGKYWMGISGLETYSPEKGARHE